MIQLHRICSSDKAVVDREPKYSYLIKTCLIQKRDQLVAQLHRLDYRMEEIKAVRSTIEQDTRLMFGGMLERLESSSGHKTSILQHEMSGIQQEIDNINMLIQQFVGLTSEGVTPLEFMLKAAVMRQNMEIILNKPFKTEIEVYPFDLPRELLQIRKEIEENNQLEMLLKMKDNVIWSLMNELKQVYHQSVKDLDLAANQEISGWASLTDKFTTELQEFQRICYYCAEPLNEESINTECTVNIDKSIADKCRWLLNQSRDLQRKNQSQNTTGPSVITSSPLSQKSFSLLKLLKTCKEFFSKKRTIRTSRVWFCNWVCVVL